MAGEMKMLVGVVVGFLGVGIIFAAGPSSAVHHGTKRAQYQQPNTQPQVLESVPASEVEYVDGPLAPLYDFLIQHRLQRFCKLLRDANLEQAILDLGGSWTLFAPTDASFVFLPGGTIEELQRNPQLLQDFILYHFVVGDFPSSQIQNEILLNSAQGAPLRFNIYGQTKTVSGSQILEPDLLFELGRVYIIDRPLYPIPSLDIVTYLRTNYREMYRLLLDVGLIDYLSSGTFTLLVPDDEAFGYLSVDLKDALATNRSLAERILLNHILPGSVYVGGITNGMQWETSGGNFITFTVNRGLTFADDIPIVLPDVPLTNGVIHVVNRVLLPEGVDADCHCKPSSDARTGPQGPTGSRPSVGQSQRPQYGQSPTTRRPGPSVSGQTPRPFGSQAPGSGQPIPGSGQPIPGSGQPRPGSGQPRPVGSPNRAVTPATSPGLSGNRPWSPSRAGQTVRPLSPPNPVTRSPYVSAQAEPQIKDEDNSLVGVDEQPVSGQKIPDTARTTRYPSQPTRRVPTPRPPPQRVGFQPTRNPQGAAHPGSENENYPEQDINAGISQTTRRPDRWSNQRTTTLRGPHRTSATTRRPQTTKAYDWNQPRGTQLGQGPGIESTTPNPGQVFQTQRPASQVPSWQQRTTRQPYQRPSPPTQTRPTTSRPYGPSQPQVPSNEQDFGSNRQQPSCRRQGERVNYVNRNLPVCSELEPEGCQNLPYDSSDSRPLCPEIAPTDCRNPNDPADPTDNRPLCQQAPGQDCREFGQPTYAGDRRPLCPPSPVPQTGCRDPSAPFNPSDRRPLCRTPEPQTTIQPSADDLGPSDECRRPDERASPQDRRPLCSPSVSPRRDCRDPSEPFNPSDRRPLCRTTNPPRTTSPVSQEFGSPDGCRRPDETPNPQDRRPLCPEEPQQDCRPLLERPKPGDRRPVCKTQGSKPVKDVNKDQKKPVKPQQPQSGQYPTQTTRRQSWQTTTIPPQRLQTTTNAPQRWQTTTSRVTTRAPQRWQTTTRKSTVPQHGSSQTTSKPQSSFQIKPQTGLTQPQGGSISQPDSGSYPSGPSGPSQSQSGAYPSQPESGDHPSQPQTSQPQSGRYPSHAQKGSYPSRPQSGRYPSQPQTGSSQTSAPPSGSYPSQPQSGSYPGQPDPGSRTKQPQPGSQPEQPQSGSYPGQPGQPQSVSYPGRPQTGSYPGSPQSGSYPEQPGRPHSGSYPRQPGQPQTGSYPGQPGIPETDSHPGQPGQPETVSFPGQPHSGSYPGQPQTGSYPGQPQTGSYPGQPQTGSYPGQPQTGSYPGQPQTGSYPGQPQTGSYPGQPQTDSYPGQPGQPQTGSYPGQPGQPESGSYPGQPESGSYPGQPGLPQTGSYPGQPGRPHSGSYPRQPGQPQSGSYPRQPVSGSFPGQPDSGSYPSQPQTGTHSTTSQPGSPHAQPQAERPGQPQTGTYPSRPGVQPSQQPGYLRPTQPHRQPQPGRPGAGFTQRPVSRTPPTSQPQTQGFTQPGSADVRQPLTPGSRPVSGQGHQSGSFTTTPRRPTTTPRVPVSVTGTSTTPNEDTRRTLYEIVEDPSLQIRGRPVQLTKIFALFHKAGIEDVLTGPGPTTVFLPSDDAFATLPRGVVEQLEENPEFLRQVLLYHVAQAEILPSAQGESYTVPSMEGTPLVITMLSGGRLILISGAKAVAVTRANNGIFYVINQLLYPLPHHDIFGAIQTRPDLTTLAYFLSLSGLTNMLQGETPYTLLAPTDTAFAQLPQAAYDELTRNTTALQELLLNHIFEGAHYGREFLTGASFPSARGGKLRFQVVSYGYQVNDVNIKTPEIVTGTGVIHLIDQVLLDDSDLKFFNSIENSVAGEDGYIPGAQQPGADGQPQGLGPVAPVGSRPVSGQGVPGSQRPGTGQPHVGGLQPVAVGRIPTHGQSNQRTPSTQPQGTGPHQPGTGSVGLPHSQGNQGQPNTGSFGYRQGGQRQPTVGSTGQPVAGQQTPGQLSPGSYGGRRQPSTRPVTQPQGHQTPGQSGNLPVGGQRVPTHGQLGPGSNLPGQRQPGTHPASHQGPGTFQTGGQPNDVADLARSMGLNQFANWITNTGLLEKIHDGGVYTVFAPTDEAVDSLPQDMVYSIQSDPEQVKPILQYHIVPQRINLNSVTNEETASTLLQGKKIRFNVYQNSQPDCRQLVTASGTPVGEALATMGSIQVIPVQQVLYQPTGNLLKIVEASPILQKLNDAVKAARLTWILSGNGPMTIFAPSDSAFDSLTDEQRKTLIEDKQAFSELLKRHIVRGTFFSSGIQEDVEKKSENNKPMKLSLQEGILTVNSVPVTYADITASNGVLHVIDQFLL